MDTEFIKKNLFFSVFILFLSGCTSSPKSAEPGRKNSDSLKLVRTCTSNVGRWEVYNKSGLFRRPAEQIHFFAKNGEAPRITQTDSTDPQAAEDFKNGVEILESLRRQGNVICEGTEKFNKEDIGELKESLVLYAATDCKEEAHVQKMKNKIKKWQLTSAPTHTSTEINTQDQILDATRYFFAEAAAPHDKNSCPRIVERAVKALLTLPLKN